MDIHKLSSSYTIKPLTPQDLLAIYALSVGNPLFYQHCPPFVTEESILEDMQALPPGKTSEDKYYLGFWDKEQLIAILDLIINYPDEQTAFIGLFMMQSSMQGAGTGSRIIQECAQYLKGEGYLYLRLGYAKGNPQSEHFWKKNGFENTGIEREGSDYTVVVLQKTL